jgi:ribosomal protein L37AE/L43A
VGDYVVPLFISSPMDAIHGIVTHVSSAEDRVYVAWNGGPVKQHDPDEIMVAVRNVKVENNTKTEDVVIDNPTMSDAQDKVEKNGRKASIGRRKTALYHGGVGRTYRRTRAEINEGAYTCPSCKGNLDLDKYMKSVKIYVCPNCGWKITTDKVV